MDTREFKNKNVSEKIDEVILVLEENGFYMHCDSHKNDFQRNICFRNGDSLNSRCVHLYDIRPFYCNFAISNSYDGKIKSIIEESSFDLNSALYFIYHFHDVLFEVLEKYEYGKMFWLNHVIMFEETETRTKFDLHSYEGNYDNKLAKIRYEFDETFPDKYKFHIEIMLCS